MTDKIQTAGDIHVRVANKRMLEILENIKGKIETFDVEDYKNLIGLEMAVQELRNNYENRQAIRSFVGFCKDFVTNPIYNPTSEELH